MKGMIMTWKNIDTAPKDKEILLGLKDGWDGPPYYSCGEVCAGYWDLDMWLCSGTGEQIEVEFNPTHWQTLPEPPEGDFKS